MSKEIRALYTKRGLTPPDGKGIHTRDFHSCVAQCKANQRKGGRKKVNCYAVCMSSLGKTRAVKKSHQRV